MLASSATSNNSSYSNDRGPGLEPEYAADPASGSFFHSDFKKHDDLKEMLDSNKDSLKLEAMKRIIGMIAKGRDASVLFPSVVKNVVSKNIEVKKLVYVYLERYAEEQQDLALLSISTFQRALKEPNQLIRAGALRVLSSIRVSMIAPIVMLAIRDAAADMSPYVRKTAAHAIPKLYSLDQEQKPELIIIIQKLLADRTVLVIGSAVMAFTKVCPERVDLIHQVYRKLCALLVDVDEWGQVIIVNLLTRYARTQFADPKLHEGACDNDYSFYDSGSENSEKPAPPLDPDHRLLLRSVRPLLQSRNAAVVMAVAQLYHHAAPRSEGPLAAKALVRLLRSHTEVQSVVLNVIASISAQKRGLFEPFLKSFFIRTSDPTKVKLLKLEILTNLATDSNVSVILRELQTYIASNDKQFVAATIQAIGRCACSISEVTDSCLNGLVSLLSNRDEAVVAESVVVIKRLLQTQAAGPKEIVTHMARLLDSITVAQARAAILWLIGEHSKVVPRIAPDVLRKLTKSFGEEHDIVKLQILNLAVKLYITNPEQTALLCKYAFNLARYDQNYDIRDRARLLKQFTQNSKGKITEAATRIFLAAKPAPALQSQFKDGEQLQLGSLSHYIKFAAVGYEPLPPFPEQPPSGEVRNVEPIGGDQETSQARSPDKKKKGFFSWSSQTTSSESSSEESDSSSSPENEEEDDDELSSSHKKTKKQESRKEGEEEEEDDDDEDDSEDSSSSSSSSSSSEESDSSSENSNGHNHQNINNNAASNKMKETSNNNVNNEKDKKGRKDLDLLLDLDDIDTVVPVMTPSLGGFLTPVNMPVINANSTIQIVHPRFVPLKEIEALNRISGRGLSISYRYTRNPHLFSPHMVNINLTFTNTNMDDIKDIKLEKKAMASGICVNEFTCVNTLAPNCSLPGTLGIDFNDSTQPANLEISSSIGSVNISIKPTVGELLKPVTMSEATFSHEQSKLRGMNEHSATVALAPGTDVSQRVFQAANLGSCPSPVDSTLRYAGYTLTTSSLVLVTVFVKENQATVTTNCEKMVIGSMLLNELKSALK